MRNHTLLFIYLHALNVTLPERRGMNRDCAADDVNENTQTHRYSQGF